MGWPPDRTPSVSMWVNWVTNNQLIYFYIFIFLSVSIIVYRGPSPIPHPPINKSFVGTIAGNQTRTAMILPAS